MFGNVTSPVTYTLLFANAAIFLWSYYSHRDYTNQFAEWPYQIVRRKKYYQVITSGFLHAGWMHLFFNLFTLYSFGTFLESFFVKIEGPVFGSIYFFVIYFVSLLCGSLLTVATHYKDPGYVAVGASGAISGIIFSFIIFFPFSQISLFFIPMPAFLFAILYIVASVYGMKQQFGNIGHEAHLGGALGGVIATLILIDGAMKILIGHFS
jgi:membrane associated rhomboid family serine protease